MKDNIALFAAVSPTSSFSACILLRDWEYNEDIMGGNGLVFVSCKHLLGNRKKKKNRIDIIQHNSQSKNYSSRIKQTVWTSMAREIVWGHQKTARAGFGKCFGSYLRAYLNMTLVCVSGQQGLRCWDCRMCEHVREWWTGQGVILPLDQYLKQQTPARLPP